MFTAGTRQLVSAHVTVSKHKISPLILNKVQTHTQIFE